MFFTDVKDGNLEFTAIAYVPSPRKAFGVKSELLFQIIPDLRAQGMSLASSNAVVNVGLSERFVDPNPTRDQTHRSQEDHGGDDAARENQENGDVEAGEQSLGGACPTAGAAWDFRVENAAWHGAMSQIRCDRLT